MATKSSGGFHTTLSLSSPYLPPSLPWTDFHTPSGRKKRKTNIDYNSMYHFLSLSQPLLLPASVPPTHWFPPFLTVSFSPVSTLFSYSYYSHYSFSYYSYFYSALLSLYPPAYLPYFPSLLISLIPCPFQTPPSPPRLSYSLTPYFSPPPSSFPIILSPLFMPLQ